MSDNTAPLLGHRAPSNFWPNVALGTTAVVGIAASGHQGYSVRSEGGSWTGLVGSLLCVIASGVGLYAVRRWSIWNQSQNSQTASVAKVMGHVPAKDKLLELIVTLDARIDALYTQHYDAQAEDANALVDHDLDENPLPEKRLERMQTKIDRLMESYAGKAVQFEGVQRELGLLRTQLEAQESQGLQPSKPAHARDASSVLDQLGSLEAMLSGLRPNASFSSSAGGSPGVSPMKLPGAGRLNINVLPPTVAERDPATDDT